MTNTVSTPNTDSVTEFTVIASVSLTLPAASAEEARAKAQEILDSVDGWPTVDIEAVEQFA
jgi:hypothetical protein